MSAIAADIARSALKQAGNADEAVAYSSIQVPG